MKETSRLIFETKCFGTKKKQKKIVKTDKYLLKKFDVCKPYRVYIGPWISLKKNFNLVG